MADDDGAVYEPLVSEMVNWTQGRAYLEFFEPEARRVGYEHVYAMATTRHKHEWVLGFLPFPVLRDPGSRCRWYFRQANRWEYGWELHGWSAHLDGKATLLRIRPIDDEQTHTVMNDALGPMPEDLVQAQMAALRDLSNIALII